MPDRITLRPGRPDDLDRLGSICFEAFSGISGRHGFPPDFPAREVAVGMIGMVLSAPHVFSVVAELDGRVVGSNFLWEDGPVGGVGPITVDPAAQGHDVGRRLMEAVLERGRERSLASVRLVQAAFNTTSMSLYTKLGFDVREPLVCMQGTPRRVDVPGHTVRAATDADVPACADLCHRVHGHARSGDLRGAIARGSATVCEHAGRVTAYMTDLGFFGHAVARENSGLMALIGASKQVSGPGFLLPSRNGEVFRWCLANGLRVVQPMTLMSLGLYNEPRGAFIASILY